jgi:hypothetical protein
MATLKKKLKHYLFITKELFFFLKRGKYGKVLHYVNYFVLAAVW